MIDNTSTRSTQVELTDGAFWVDASLLGELLGIQPSDVQRLMRDRELTSLCEHGVAEHKGKYRLTFFYKGRRARLSVDDCGHIIQRSVLNFGDRGLPPAMHKPGC